MRCKEIWSKRMYQWQRRGRRYIFCTFKNRSIEITFLEVMNVDEAKMVSGIGNDKIRKNKKGREKNRKKKNRAGCC